MIHTRIAFAVPIAIRTAGRTVTRDGIRVNNHAHNVGFREPHLPVARLLRLLCLSGRQDDDIVVYIGKTNAHVR